MTRSLLLAALLLSAPLAFPASVQAALPAEVEGTPMPSLAPMLERTTLAVVNVSSKTRVQVRNPFFDDPIFRRFFDQQNVPQERVEQSLGSGVIVDAARGLVLTNNHVIERADEVSVTLHDGRTLNAEIIGSDPDTDVAVIRVPAQNLTALTLANSDALRVGDFVVAIGNPFGLGQTVTSGIVSALGRNQLGINTFENFIQTDAAINPGNSGGALVDVNGHLMGINTAIYSRSGGSMGIGFAIPVSTAQMVLESIVREGRVSRGWIGVEPNDLSPELAETFGVKAKSGVIITGVLQNAPAAQAGIRPGDVITAVAGKPTASVSDLLSQVAALKAGVPARFTLLRREESVEIEITPTQRPRPRPDRR